MSREICDFAALAAAERQNFFLINSAKFGRPGLYVVQPSLLLRRLGQNAVTNYAAGRRFRTPAIFQQILQKNGPPKRPIGQTMKKPAIL